MNRNYSVSIGIHILFLLLILLFPLMNKNEKRQVEVEQVVIVDFTKMNSQKSSPAKSSAKKKSIAPPKAESQKKKKSDPSPKAKKKVVKNIVKKAADEPGSSEEVQKPPKIEEPKGPTPEEIAEQKRKEEKAAKKSAFSALLNKSKKVEKSEAAEGDGSIDGPKDNIGESPNRGNGNIRGALGNRKVIKVPKIKDDSQKKGRVVVKICVDQKGDVISSQYTMMGSTTSDTYLIKLAENGAKGYKFSPSVNPKECGKVVIDFLLK